MNNQYEDFLTKNGLYSRAPINEDSEQDWLHLLEGKVKINCYCSECKEKRVFSLEPPRVRYQDKNGDNMTLADYLIKQKQKYNLEHTAMPMPNRNKEIMKWFWRQEKDALLSRIITLTFHCAMDEHHFFDVVLRTGDDYVEKIGQKPSLADLSFAELNRYKTVSGGEQTIKELKRAIGLNAQGIGVGSYVYLRRIFEKIIEQAKINSISNGNVQENAFHNKKMDEQISLLKDDLPDVIVNNKVFYKIVSKGIHDLSEEECIEFFPILRDAIILIWNEWQRKLEEQNTKESLTKSLNQISSKL